MEAETEVTVATDIPASLSVLALGHINVITLRQDSQIEPPDISGPSHPPEQLPERSEVDTSLEEHDKVSAAPSSFAADYLDDDFENDDEFDEDFKSKECRDSLRADFLSATRQ